MLRGHLLHLLHHLLDPLVILRIQCHHQLMMHIIHLRIWELDTI